MTVRVERPSRTFEEAIRERFFGILKKGFKWYLILAIGVGLLVGGIGSGSPAFGVILAGPYFLFVFRRPLRRFYRRLREPAADTETIAEPATSENESDEPMIHGPERPVWVGEVISEQGESSRGLWLDNAIRNRHCYVVGKTRTGKSTLLKSLAIQDVVNDRGLAFIDPHGDAASELLDWIPEERVGDVIYFDPTDKSAPAFNPFALPYSPPKLAEDIVSVFRLLVGESSWGPRMEHLLRYGVLSLLADREPRSLRDLRRLFLDERFRREVTDGLESESLREFWELEFPSIPEAAANPILNKLSAFLAPMSHLERVFSARENDLDFTTILDSGKILVVNLAKGVLGEEPARLLGGLLVTGLQQAALARAARPANERRDFFLYVDEFQNFTVASFESILSESAKYRLNLTLANQNLGQLDKDLQRALFGNCGTLMAFQVSAEDAGALRKEMHRSRLVVRPREQSEFCGLSEFVAYQKQVYREALADKYLGMNAKERRWHRTKSDVAKAGGFMTGVAQQMWTSTQMSERRAEMERVLALLESGPFEVQALGELFPDYEFRELSFPDVDDFLNLGVGVAFCRVGSADNVCAIQCGELPEPDPTRREAVVAEMEKRFARPPEAQPSTAPTRHRDPEPASFRE